MTNTANSPRVTANVPIANGLAMVTATWSSRSEERPGSSAGEPMVKVPGGNDDHLRAIDAILERLTCPGLEAPMLASAGENLHAVALLRHAAAGQEHCNQPNDAGRNHGHSLKPESQGH